MNAIRQAIVVLLLAQGLASAAPAPKQGWVGKIAFVRQSGLMLFEDPTAMPPRELFRSGFITYTVLADRDGWVKVRDNDREGWLRKSDLVLVDDAPAYFTTRIRAEPQAVTWWYFRSVAQRLKGNLPEAIDDMTEVMRLQPNSAFYLTQRAHLWMQRKDFDKATADLDKALELDPGNKNTYQVRAQVFSAKKDFDKALADYDKALEIDAQFTLALNNSAWMLATCATAKVRDGKKAVERATKACELTNWKNPTYLDTLAAASAEAGAWDEAVKWQKKALEDTAFASNESSKARQRLRQYESKKPHREE